jgi:FixJ family two-component response regulator
MSFDPSKAPRVAVIDDEEPVRLALLALLEAQGYEAVLFESAEAFLAAAQPGGYACILLDLWLKNRMNGLAFLRDFPAVSQAVPVVMMTRQADIPSAFQAGQLGVVAYLPKPVLPSQLSEALTMAREKAHGLAQAAPLPVALPALLAWVKAAAWEEWRDLLQAAEGRLAPGQLRRLREVSHREVQVWGWVADCGPTNKEIARALAVSEKTVDAHYTSLKEKLAIPGLHARAAPLKLRDALIELLSAAGRLP